MSLLNRISKLEKANMPPDISGTCECANGVLSEFRDFNPDAIYPDEVPVYCQTCKRQRRKIIVEFVPAKTEPRPGETFATFNIETNKGNGGN